jgi:hypothetical protein
VQAPSQQRRGKNSKNTAAPAATAAKQAAVAALAEASERHSLMLNEKRISLNPKSLTFNAVIFKMRLPLKSCQRFTFNGVKF